MPRTTLLLLPGLLCDATLWRHQAAALAGHATVVVADLTRDDSVAAMAARALDAVRAAEAEAGAGAPLAVAGLSMGGYVALALLRAAPGRVSRLLLMDTTARPDTPEQARRRRGLMALTRRGGTRFRGVTPRLLPELLHPDRSDDAALAATVIGMAERVGRDAFLRQLQAILDRPDARPGLAELRLRAHVAVGEADRRTPPELAHEMARLIPGAALSVLAGCGHLPPLEDPGAVTALMQAWLEDHDA